MSMLASAAAMGPPSTLPTHPGVVIIGAGSAGIAAARGLTPHDICDGAVAKGPVVVFDDDHYYMGGLIAELLRGKGLDVMLVTPAADVSHWTHNTLEQSRIQKRLIEMGVQIVALHSVVARGADAATLECVYTGRQRDIACGTLVNVTMQRPVDGLYHDLLRLTGAGAPGPKTLVRIGDCLAPGTIAAAVYAGHRYARELGAPPADGVPFRRVLPALATD